MIAPQYSPDPRAPLQIASVQTLVRRLANVPAPDFIIVDEAHHSVSKSYQTILAAHPKVKILGVTATPERLDGKGLGSMFQAMVIGPSVSALTRDGFLSPALCFVPPPMVDMRGVTKRGGDYAKDELAERMDRPTITGDAVSHYRRICPGERAIAFCVSVAHAEHVAAQFQDGGFRSASVDGSMTDTERARRIGGLELGAVQVLTSCDLVSEGLDIPAVVAAILLRPTHSLALARQQMGRPLRIWPGKECSYILDHAGNIHRHGRRGLPSSEIEWSLDGAAGRKKEDAEKIAPGRQCPGPCYCFYDARLQACPACGRAPPIQSRVVEQVNGELVEMATVEADRARAAKAKELKIAGNHRAKLEQIAKERGYNPGWVDHRLRAIRATMEKYRRLG
jgi:superfamily II DNA or RNA helicase